MPHNRQHAGGVKELHFVCAAVFISSLAVISYYFGRREGARQRERGKRSPLFWQWFHWSCASAIAAALVFIAITKVFDWFDSYSVLIGETVAGLAFGLSWLMKGLEIKILWTPKGTGQPPPPPPAATEDTEGAVTSARRSI